MDKLWTTSILLNGNFLAFSLFFRKYAYIAFNLGLTIMEIPDEMLKEIRESGYDQELVYNYIRELLDSEKRKFPKENNNLELIDNYLLDQDVQEPAAEILMASELIDNYLLDKRFMRELEDRDEYDAA